MTDCSYIYPMRRKVDKETLLEVGKSLLHKQGYHATGIKDIADAAGILKGSFYNYFKGKEAFCKEALEKYSMDFYEASRNILHNPGLSPLTRLKTLFSYRINYMISDQNCSKGCFLGNTGQELAESNEVLRSVIDEAFQKETGLFADCIIEAQKSKEIKSNLDPYKAAEFITLSWQGALLRMKTSKDELPLRVFYQMVFEQFL